MTGGGRVRDIAILLPIGALLLFLPPYARLFDQPTTVLGVPLLPLAIFSFWFLGIVITAVAARALRRQEAGAAEPDPEPEHEPGSDAGPPHHRDAETG